MDDCLSMARDITVAPDVVARQELVLARPLAELAARLRRHPPQTVVTCARGSSAHAATFGKHLIERYIGVPVCTAAPGIASIYGQRLRLKDQLVLAISQSGSSDDLIAFLKSARAAQALTVAITNDENAPLAAISDVTIPMGAGTELSVPATKTFVASLVVLMRLTAAWTSEAILHSALRRLPQRLQDAGVLDWTSAVDMLAGIRSVLTVGRGPTLAIAQEAALKLKETCNLHAEAFSGAEVLHGPVALISRTVPVLAFMPTDKALESMQSFVTALIKTRACLLVAQPGHQDGHRLPVLVPDQPEADAICLIQSFYSMLVRLARCLGTDADRPRNLRKITRTT